MAKKPETPSHIVLTPVTSMRSTTSVTYTKSVTSATAVKSTVGKSLAIEWSIDGVKKRDHHILVPNSLIHEHKISNPELELAPATNTTDPPIPVTAERLLFLFLPKSDREYWLGDLEEIYRTDILPRHGPRYAKWWYRTQVLRSTGHILLKWLSGIYSVVKLTNWLWRTFGL